MCESAYKSKFTSSLDIPLTDNQEIYFASTPGNQESICIVQNMEFNLLILQDFATAQAVSRQPLTAVAQVQFLRSVVNTVAVR
jgi:hypothetical protein